VEKVRTKVKGREREKWRTEGERKKRERVAEAPTVIRDRPKVSRFKG